MAQNGAGERDRGESQRRTPGADEAFCTSCGETIKAEAEICPECGVRQKDSEGTAGTQPNQQIKNPGIAAVASFFFTGLGQIYNGQIGKGIALIVVQVINIALMFVLVGFLTYTAVWIYGIYDAYQVATRINKGDITV